MTKRACQFIIIFFILFHHTIFAQQPQEWKVKVSSILLSKLQDHATETFIVLMKDQENLSEAKNIHGKEAKGAYAYQKLTSFAESSQKKIIEELEKHHSVHQSFWVVNSLRVVGDEAMVKTLAERDDVERILDNTPMGFAKPVSMDTVYSRDLTRPWGIDSIHAPAVWLLGIKGAGVVVGGQDTGYDWTHPAIKSQYRGWNGITADHNYNWHDAIHAPDPHNSYPNPCGIDISSPCDDYGHGTHTMGTMVGEADSLKIGVAPEAKWIGERNMEQGWGNLASYMEGFEWFIAPTDTNNLNPDPAMAPHVINNSWVCTGDEGCDISNFSLLEDVVNNVKASGIVVVASAGNNGPYCNTIFFPPAIYEASFSVGAIDSTMTIASFSSRGNVTTDSSSIVKPNVAAPGVDVYSCIPGSQYAYFSGTSMAGPHTAGTVALVICANPLLAGEVDQIENIIEQSAHPVITNEGCGGDGASSIPNNTYGWGTIDALAAVQLAQLATIAEIYGAERNITVFPSITRDELFLNFDQVYPGASVELFSVMGELLSTLKLNASRNILHLQGLTPGMYLYRVRFDGKFMSGKVVKQ